MWLCLPLENTIYTLRNSCGKDFAGGNHRLGDYNSLCLNVFVLAVEATLLKHREMSRIHLKSALFVSVIIVHSSLIKLKSLHQPE